MGKKKRNRKRKEINNSKIKEKKMKKNARNNLKYQTTNNSQQFDFFQTDGTRIDQVMGADEMQICFAISGFKDSEGRMNKGLAMKFADKKYDSIPAERHFSGEPEALEGLQRFQESSPDYGDAIIMNATVKKRKGKPDLIHLNKVAFDNFFIPDFAMDDPESSMQANPSTEVDPGGDTLKEDRVPIHKIASPDDKVHSQTHLKIPEGTSHEVNIKMMISMVENPDGKVIKGMVNEYLDSDYDYSGPINLSGEQEALDDILSYFESHSNCGDFIIVNTTVTQNPNGPNLRHCNHVVYNGSD